MIILGVFPSTRQQQQLVTPFIHKQQKEKQQDYERVSPTRDERKPGAFFFFLSKIRKQEHISDISTIKISMLFSCAALTMLILPK